MQDRRRWAAPVGDQIAWRRAGGRRHYNATRQLRAALPRAELLAIVGDFGGLLQRGVQVRLARYFGVSEATISRDLRGILAPRPGQVPQLRHPGPPRRRGRRDSHHCERWER